MFKKNFRGILGLLLVLFVAGSLATGCYDDSELRASIDELKTQLDQLKTLVSTLQNDDAVTGVTQNADGSYTISFKKSGAVTIKNGADGQNGNDGNDGKDGTIINVVKGEDSYTFFFSDGTTIILPRYYEVRVLTFEDADYKGASETTSYWSNLVDDPQNNGPLLYGNGYAWLDDNNTFLSGAVAPFDYEAFTTFGFGSGGAAISNYGNGDFTGADPDRQLEVFNPKLEGAGRKGCGNNESDNFVVLYDAGEWAAADAGFSMNDSVARVIESVYVNNTCYAINVLKNGSAYGGQLASDGYFKVTATGYCGELKTNTLDFYLAENLSIVSKWVKWDLSGLGKVDMVIFSLSGSPELYNYGYLSAPAYFAIDDIAVRVYPDEQ